MTIDVKIEVYMSRNETDEAVFVASYISGLLGAYQYSKLWIIC